MSSRIICKNLPRDIKESRLKEIFSEYGQVTQVKILNKRRFCYVGFSEAAAAKAAIRQLNETYLDTSKIEVADALPVGDKQLPRPWSKFSDGSSAHARHLKKKEVMKQAREKAAAGKSKPANKKPKLSVDERVAEERLRLSKLYDMEADPNADPKLKEFIDVMRPSTAKHTWANDSGSLALRPGQSDKMQQKAAKVKAKIEAVPSRKRGGEGLHEVKVHLTFDDSDEEYQDVSNEPSKTKEEEEEGEEESSSSESEEEEKEDVAFDDTVSNMDYLRSKMGAKNSKSDSEDDSDSADDESEQQQRTPQPARKSKGAKKNEAKEKTVNSEEPGERHSIRVRGLPFSATEDQIREFFYPLEPLDIRMPLDRKSRPSGRAYLDFATAKEATEALQRNNDHMGKRYVEVTRETDGPREQRVREDFEEGGRKKSKFPELQQEDMERLAESGRIFIRNLAYTCTEDDLREAFEKFGPLSECHLPLDNSTKKSKGIAFITFVLPENAVQGFTELDGTIFQGRLLHLIPAKLKREMVDDSEVTYKKRKEKEMKEKSGRSFNWNTLFMRSDTVADAMAESYGVDKAEILDPEAENSTAVRLALGETHIVATNKDFLKEHGVHLDAFEVGGKERSKTTILVKNIPYDATEADLKNLFEKHGALGTVVVPPSNTMALVDFLEPSEARTAFRSLAYRQFKHQPLYLEWAPVGVFQEKKEKKRKAEETDGSASSSESEDDTVAQAEEEATPTATLFVKNLNFETREDALRQMFGKIAPVKSVSVATKKGKSGEVLSMGFGFVEFGSLTDAKNAMKKLQGVELDNHPLELKISNRANQGTTSEKSRKRVTVGGTKLLVRNLAFEATKKELRELFQAFGQVKSIRLPRKFDGTHRGFAFVDLLTKQEAKNAFEALSASTHLYGRRLVIEWAKDDDSVDSIREKTREKSLAGGSRKRTKAWNISEDKV